MFALDFVIQLLEMSATFSYQVLKLTAGVETFLPRYVLAIPSHNLFKPSPTLTLSQKRACFGPF